jgi:hypothetical protein
MERMQSLYENLVDHNLSESGVEPMRLGELLAGAEAEEIGRIQLGYGWTCGSAGLRDRIAALYPGATRDNVLVTNGGAEANFVSFWTLLEKGDRVAIQIPNYFQSPGLAAIFGARADRFHLVPQEEGGVRRWALDPASLDRAVTKRTRILLVTNPNNPTGAVLRESEMDAIVRAARRAGAWIVADEIYRGAELSGRSTPTFYGRYPRVLVTSGLSKAFGLPGLRIGWAAGPAKLIQDLWSHHDYTTIGPSILSDRLAAIALEPRRRDAILRRTRSILRRNLAVLEEWVRRSAGRYDLIPPEAGAIAFLRCRRRDSIAALAERLRRDRSLLLVPGEHFGLPGFIRIGYGYSLEGLRSALRRFDDAAIAVRATRRRVPSSA